ncbi:hypothetical protein BIFDEN_00845 [Bifidobacterium dentium ATCC 27678]|nr:hypothetical protein BIFDEN_00845 [Bifidobacterium dentium ATCC 27678]
MYFPCKSCTEYMQIMHANRQAGRMTDPFRTGFDEIKTSA